MLNMDRSRDAARGMADIAMLMGTTDDWDADMVDRIGDMVMRAGFPHPGEDVTHEEYLHQAVPVWNDINVELHRAERTGN